MSLTVAPAQDCGHPPAQDDELFDQRLSPQAAAPPPQTVILAYDERMTLHAEGQWSSHPERPDRVRAVMARLTASGLTGLLAQTSLLARANLLATKQSCLEGKDCHRIQVDFAGKGFVDHYC